MPIINKLRRAIRGEVTAKTVALEAVRRCRVSIRQKSERSRLVPERTAPARLRAELARMRPDALVEHFRERTQPHFFAGFDSRGGEIAAAQRRLFPQETSELLAGAERIVKDHCWPLLGLGVQCFGSPIEWHRDPLSGFDWPLDYYADINLVRGDGSDVRFLWELNRLGHLLTLARAYSITNDERFSGEFFQQVKSWDSSNPLARGVNWNCAMEVALRAMNLLGGFAVFRRAPDCDAESLALLLSVLDEHGSFIREHLEFSYVATSNHYLSDVMGLLWLGLMLPELEHSDDWRTFALSEMLREMDKQVLDDGADFESSTGYHRFVLELFLYSFILCRANGIAIEERYWKKLHKMLRFVRAYLRPDGHAPLIGDTDSGQAFPVCRRSGDDHAYLLALGAVVFEDSQLKVATPSEKHPGDSAIPPELLWLAGEAEVDRYLKLPPAAPVSSQFFPNANICVLRDRDLYLLFNAGGAGINGRGSHGHNDALSIEVSAHGCALIVDPGTYVYTADLQQRQLFRSTAYHSTLAVDGAEQNTTREETPFVIGNEARPRVLRCELTSQTETVSAEHYGYQRLGQPVIHQRSVVFDKERRCWFISDRITGQGDHDLAFRFHFAPGLQLAVNSDGVVDLFDAESNTRLLIAGKQLGVAAPLRPELEDRFSSRDYGAKEASRSACWSMRTGLPLALNFVVVPVGAGENALERMQAALSLEG